MLLAVLSWAFANTIVKIAHVQAVSFAFYRLWLGSAIMVFVLLLLRRRVGLDIFRRAAPGGLLFGLNIVFFFSAIRLTSIADVLVIGALQPALTLLVAGPLFGERVGLREALLVGVSIAGVLLVTIGSSGTPVWSLRGDIFAALALLAWTAYFIVSKLVRVRMRTIEYMTAVTVIGALVVTPIALLSGQPLGNLRLQDWLWLLVFLAGAQGGHLLIAWAHPQVDVSISSLLILAEPIVGAVAAFLVLGEPITSLMMVGAVVVVSALGWLLWLATRTGRVEIREPQT